MSCTGRKECRGTLFPANIHGKDAFVGVHSILSVSKLEEKSAGALSFLLVLVKFGKPLVLRLISNKKNACRPGALFLEKSLLSSCITCIHHDQGAFMLHTLPDQ